MDVVGIAEVANNEIRIHVLRVVLGCTTRHWFSSTCIYVVRSVRGICLDRRVFVFYVNPHTSTLCGYQQSEDWAYEERSSEAKKGQGVTQMGGWRVESCWNWGVAGVMKWKYDNVANDSLAQAMHRRVVERRASIDHNYKRGNG